MGMQQTTLILDTASEVEAKMLSPSAVPASALPLDEKVAIAITAIKAQVLAGRHLAVAWSGGKVLKRNARHHPVGCA